MQINKKDNNKVCFVLCYNNEKYLKEATYYINKLEIPDGYVVEVMPILGAKSMASGYNSAIANSDAKYKVYMHQDVFIVNRYFIYDILDIFKDKSVGMLGVVGAPKLHESKVMWLGDRCGTVYSSNVATSCEANMEVPIADDYMEVEVIDGLLMATAYDIEWREDVFKEWDFYDVSQSLEFRKRGYKVVVSRQEKPWCLHDEGYMKLGNYFKNLEVLKKEYFS